MKIIDFRSDTVTRPTREMRQAMMDAEVGDDVYGDDPTVNRLEALAADMLGKEAALFVPTGAMGNEIAVMTHTRPGEEIICAADSHIYHSEAGGPARLAGVSAALVETSAVSAADIHRLVRPDNVHYPRTTLVCLENALGNGDVMTVEEMREAHAAAKAHGLRVHLDGARLFNAATALGVEARSLAACADTVMFCVSKGLCSPIGSLLCGEAPFIREARRCRKLLGGGMRQVGVVAACGIVSLTSMTGRLAEDHENARRLGRGLAAIPGLSVAEDRLKINMVFWRPEHPGFDSQAFVAFMKEKGVVVSGAADGKYRFITHNDISAEDVNYAVKCIGGYVATL